MPCAWCVYSIPAAVGGEGGGRYSIYTPAQKTTRVRVTYRQTGHAPYDPNELPNNRNNIGKESKEA